MKPKNGQSREVLTGVRVVESEYRVQRPVFKDITIEKPVFVDKQVEMPVGMDKTLDKMASILYDRLMEKILSSVDKQLEDAINHRIKEIEVPKIIYKEEERKVIKPVFTEVEVSKPVFVNKEVINPVLKNVEVKNPILKDVEIANPIFKDHIVPRAKFEEFIVQKPKWVEKTVHAIHIKYVDPQGNLESEEDLK